MTALGWLARIRDDWARRRRRGLAWARSWTGLDLIGEDSARTRNFLPLLVLALIAALAISALRIDLIRVRYAMATAMAEEKTLLEEHRNLIVRRRQLRDPVELAIQAHARGFRPPTQVIVLREPTDWHPEFNRAVLEREFEVLPAVAAGPPASIPGSDW